MRRIEPPDDIEHLLREYWGMGGVIQYAFFIPDTEAIVNEQTHKQAIRLAYQIWDEEFREQRRVSLNYLQTNTDYRNGHPSDKVQEQERLCLQAIEHGLQAEWDKLISVGITPYRFLGKAFKTGYQPLLPGQKSVALRPELLYMDAELKRLQVSVQPDPSYNIGNAYFENAYAYAFSDPPYGLGAADGAVRLQVFRGLNYAIFNNFTADVHIRQWTTDWCRYFDEGDEWWGSFLWTVYNSSRHLLTVTVASATD